MARAWHLMSRPQGLPTDENFALKEIDLPPIGEGQVRIRNQWLSVDPYMAAVSSCNCSTLVALARIAPMPGCALVQASATVASAALVSAAT